MRKVWIGVLAAAISLIVVAGSMMVFSGKTKRIRVEEKQAASVPQGGFLAKADVAFGAGEFLAAKKLYIQAMAECHDSIKLDEIKKKLEDTNMKVLFSPVLDENSAEYIVQPNDALAKIAKKFNTTVELIKRANNLASDIIRIGEKLKVDTSKFSVAIDKSQNVLFLKRGDEVIRTYIVSTGKDNSSPAGTFKIENKIVSPTWFKTGAVIAPDSPENILGSRWMGFDLKGYGIHGTTEPENLGKQVTLGCVRMKNEEVEELFDVIPVGTEVTVVD